MSGITIVTTVKYPHQFLSWILYHSKIGIQRVYVFIDDEKDTQTLQLCQQYPSFVIPIVNTSQLKTLYLNIFAGSQYLETFNKEVMSRQILNAEYAISLAKEEGLQWLIHIDADELIYVRNNQPLGNILQSSKNEGKYYLKFINYEVAPNTENYQNCFVEGTHFKTNGFRYIAYANGKAGIYIGENISIGVNGVHTFRTNWKHETSGEIVVLHYPSCNFEEFLKKYVILGSFPDQWFGTIPISIQFHKDARDVISGCTDSTEVCEQNARNLYRQNHVYSPAELQNENITYIDSVRKILGL